jgi:hypothetical protein
MHRLAGRVALRFPRRTPLALRQTLVQPSVFPQTMARWDRIGKRQAASRQVARTQRRLPIITPATIVGVRIRSARRQALPSAERWHDQYRDTSKRE